MSAPEPPAAPAPPPGRKRECRKRYRRFYCKTLQNPKTGQTYQETWVSQTGGFEEPKDLYAAYPCVPYKDQVTEECRYV